MTDPISDSLTRIRNALGVKKPEAVLPYSKFKRSLVELLSREGWIGKVEVVSDGNSVPDKNQKVVRKFLKLALKYDTNGSPVISGLERISRPGQRIYAGAGEIAKVRQHLGTVIVSTSKGLMTHKQAREDNMGGELICKIW